MTLIQRDGGTGPLKPRQQTVQYCANSRKPKALKIRRASTSRIRPLLHIEGVFLFTDGLMNIIHIHKGRNGRT